MNIATGLVLQAKHRATTLLFFLVPVVGSCALQPLRNEAASGSEPKIAPIEPGSQPDPGDGTIPPVTLTPPIYGFGLRDGYDDTTTTSACEHTTNQATALLTTFCAPCHNLGESSLGNPMFKDVLTVPKLVDPKTPTDMPGVPFVVPGYPERSRLFQRISEGTMPKTVGDPTVTRKLTVSEVSVIEEWIASCLGVKRPTAPPPMAMPGSTTGGATTGGTTGGATTGGAMPTTGGTMPTTGPTSTVAAGGAGGGGSMGAGGAGGSGVAGGAGGASVDAGAPEGGGFMRDGGRRGGG